MRRSERNNHALFGDLFYASDGLLPAMFVPLFIGGKMAYFYIRRGERSVR